VSFEERDVRADAQARWTLIEDLESSVTPTVVLGGRVLVGFNREEYEAALGAIEPDAESEERNA
jgi:arsenate reductase-like glutaredoxin family protein